ncbi:type II secretion system F family protein [Candidatus Parabeggiatoa sp. HSG14]|uniref:type II secretion system F family protein n=1 Tax=Candidatus Parabeggiatoa sp. HSG14 TaxID=3055593 RepID=UPI0025A86BD5|nr:type II secretion system F family protein [Thiotrichales bacterium HSG14]
MPIKKLSHKPLPAQDLANLYLQLSRLEESGIPAQKAMTLIVQDGGETGKRARVALNYLKRGKLLSEAGTRAGLFVGLDVALVKVAEAGGTFAKVFRQLTQFYEEKAKQMRQIKSHLFLPVTILLLSIFIQPIPSLISGKMTIINYIGATVGFIIQLGILAFIVLHLPRWFHSGFLKPFGGLWDKIQMNLPYLGCWFIRQSVCDFMRALGMMLQAGLPIFEALPKAYEVIENTHLRKRLQKITPRLRAGDSFADAFSQVKGINFLATQLILTGEYSGSLAEMMLHYVKIESETITLHNEMLAAWIPRIVYAVIAVWIAYGILSTGPLTSPIPEDI